MSGIPSGIQSWWKLLWGTISLIIGPITSFLLFEAESIFARHMEKFKFGQYRLFLGWWPESENYHCQNIVLADYIRGYI